ncbi:MAG: phosphotriesterase [Gammaproteobacteria bacterium]|nr:MAG: phosphotriesterase [Gammaproteobacteria bacterium]
MIRTVDGDMAPGDLGPTMMHEHVICDITPPDLAASGAPEVEITLENVWEVRHHWCRHMGNNRLTDEATAVAELTRLRDAGGSVVVDVTTAGIKPAPAKLRRIARASGIDIVAGCGCYTEEFVDPAVADQGVETLAGEMIRAIVDGFDDGDVQAGIIGEIGCSDAWTVLERRVMQAAVVAQRETGAAITVHPGRRPEAPAEVVTFVAAEGGDVERTIVGHIDRTVFDDDTLFRLADTGCVIEYDLFGIEQTYYPFQDIDLPNDGMRLLAIRRLIDRGHLDGIVISQDICTKTRLRHHGGHGYAHILANVVPMMRRRGFDDAEIDAILVANPRRLLSLPRP